MGKWFIRGNLDAKKGTQRLPAFFHIIDQQTLCRDALFDVFDVLCEESYRLLFVFDPHSDQPIPHERVHDVSRLVHGRRKGSEHEEKPGEDRGLRGLDTHAKDGAAGTLIPTLRIANGQDDSGLRVSVHELFEEGARRPIYCRLISCKNCVPFDRYLSTGGFPKHEMLRCLDQFGHMIARAKPQFFQGDLQRERSCPSEPRPDHLQPAPRRLFSLSCW